MAVQAQYTFLPDFQTSRDQQNNSLVGQRRTVNGAVLSDPTSDLTSKNASGSRKRNRETAGAGSAAAAAAAAAMMQQFRFPNPLKIPETTTMAISDNNQESIGYLQNWLLGLGGASTGGRIVSQHFTEIDALLRLHTAKLRSGLGEIQKRRHAELLQIFESQAAKKITEKDAEIERLRRKQAELEERLRQAAAENQIWFTAARNSEAVVSGLRASLDRALRSDGGCPAAPGQAEDAESCCGGGDSDNRRPCRVCRERDVSVLLLPCRHLCLCPGCEPAVDACPICHEAKNVGLQVFME